MSTIKYKKVKIKRLTMKYCLTILILTLSISLNAQSRKHKTNYGKAKYDKFEKMPELCADVKCIEVNPSQMYGGFHADTKEYKGCRTIVFSGYGIEEFEECEDVISDMIFRHDLILRWRYIVYETSYSDSLVTNWKIYITFKNKIIKA